MKPWGTEFAGRFDEHVLASDALRDNPLGDPHERPLWVYVPPRYESEPERRYPSVYMIQGLTGQLDMWRNRSAFRRNFPELADELFAAGKAPPTICVWVDCWTSLGGSQFQGLATHAGDALFEVCYLPEFRETVRVLRDDYEGSYERFWEDFRSRDEWFLDLGAEAFRRALERIGVTDVSFEIFDATHMAIEYRYPISLRYLAERLAPPG
jgi:hypothetical protein